MRNFIGLFANWGKAKHYPGITNFLVTNPMFRQLALGLHENKVDIASNADKWLEKELLTKEEYDRLYPNTRLNNKETNTTTRKNWTNNQ